MNVRDQLFSLLDTLDIEHTTIEHPAIFTVADSHLAAGKVPEPHTKNLFLKDDHKKFWLISAIDDTKINLRALAKNLPAKNLRFAQPELLKQYLQVEPGSVTWFALLNDHNNCVNAILDKSIFNHDRVGFHPLENTATTIVKPEALIQFAEALNHNYSIQDFSNENL